ncbi:MAG: hypothetical protein P8P29_04525 [Flavobacteriaceae bacterium]|nr:hypothetical protein [Flavobacteriaceae bacterium]
MGLNARNIESSGAGKFKRQAALEAGTYPARLVQVVCKGLQPQPPYQGNEKPPQVELYVTYELLDEFILDEDGNELKDKPRWISETFGLFNLSTELAKSTKRYFAIDPTESHKGDWGKLGGTAVMVTIVQTPDKKGKKDDEGNTVIYNNISSVQTMREKDAKRADPLVNPVRVFDPYEPDMDSYFALPEWLRDKIKEGLDFGGGALEKALEGLNENEEVDKRRKGGGDSEPEAKQPPKTTESEDSGDDEDW